MNTATSATGGNDAATWHAITAQDVVRRLNANTKTGLDTGEVSTRLAKYGPNRLPEAARRGPFVRFLLQFNNVLVYVLLAAGFIKLMTNLWLDACIILAWSSSTDCSDSFRKAKRRKRWTPSATCCPRKPERSAAARCG